MPSHLLLTSYFCFTVPWFITHTHVAFYGKWRIERGGCSIIASEKTHWINWFQPGNCPIMNTDYTKRQSQKAVLETPAWWKLIRQNHFWYSHWEFWTFSSSKGQASAKFCGDELFPVYHVNRKSALQSVPSLQTKEHG